MSNNTLKAQRIVLLIHKFTKGGLSVAEQSELVAWQKENRENEILFESLSDPEYTAEQIQDWSPEATEHRLVRIRHTMRAPFRAGIKFRVFGAAAAIFLIVLAGFLILRLNGNSHADYAVSGIHPGSDKATLTLSDGSVVDLDSLQSGTVLSNKGIQINKNPDGSISYNLRDNTEDLTNILSTPQGGQFQVILPDGSHVWMNASSSLKYSLSTSQPVRTVQLSGEAYFEVKRDPSRPFIVRTSNQQVTVLGTHFNISSYGNDPQTRTTLAEGSVRIDLRDQQHNNKLILRPGEQGIGDPSGLSMVKVDLDQVLDWKNGEFVFDGLTIPEIMRKVSRWYNVEVEFKEGADLKSTFGGRVSRNGSIAGLLQSLQSTGKVKFKVDKNLISVYN